MNAEGFYVADATTWRHVVVYVEYKIRDWRWLWLRKRTVTEIAGAIDLEPGRK